MEWPLVAMPINNDNNKLSGFSALLVIYKFIFETQQRLGGWKFIFGQEDDINRREWSSGEKELDTPEDSVERLIDWNFL